MLHYVRGNLLEANTEAPVIAENTVGVMDKGIALMFKEAFPEDFRPYSEASKRGKVQIGYMFVTKTNAHLGPKWIINLPTKTHWLQRSRMDGLDRSGTDRPDESSNRTVSPRSQFQRSDVGLADSRGLMHAQ